MLLCTVQLLNYFWISKIFKRFVSETPYLIHDTTKAPHITGSGVLLVVNSLLRNYYEIYRKTQFTEVPTSGAVHFTGTFPP